MANAALTEFILLMIKNYCGTRVLSVSSTGSCGCTFGAIRRRCPAM